jgi:hypothetical protein
MGIARALAVLALATVVAATLLAAVSVPGSDFGQERGSVSAAVVPGCVLLSAEEDPGGRHVGISHAYDDHPVVVVLACRSLADAERAAALLPMERAASPREVGSIASPVDY